MRRHLIEADYILVQISELAGCLCDWVLAGKGHVQLSQLAVKLLVKREERVLFKELTPTRTGELPPEHIQFLSKLGLPEKAFHNWIRIPRYTLQELMDNPCPKEAAVLFSILIKYIQRRGYSRVSFTQISNAFELGRTTIHRAVRELEFRGLLLRDKSSGREHWLRWADGTKYYPISIHSSDANALHWQARLGRDLASI